jgi:predicted enzyme related to lactoylglutathione lyase
MSPRAARFAKSTPVLQSGDYARSRAFYCEGLGFTVVEEAGDPPGFGIVERDGSRLFLDAFRGRVRADTGDHGWDAYVHVDDVDALERELDERGVKLASEPRDTNYGMRELEVVDPDGNRLGFGQDLTPGLHVTRNDYVLAVHDLERTRDWFTRVLGCTSRDIDPGNWVFCVVDSLTFMIGRCPAAPLASELGDHAYFAYLAVDDVDAWAARAARENAEILKPPTTEPWGIRELALRAPEGHRLMIGQRIFRPA